MVTTHKQGYPFWFETVPVSLLEWDISVLVYFDTSIWDYYYFYIIYLWTLKKNIYLYFYIHERHYWFIIHI